MPARRRYPLTLSARAVLVALRRSGRVLSGGELVHLAGVSWSRIVGAIAQLEDRGFVRVVEGRVAITKRGLKVAA